MENFLAILLKSSQVYLYHDMISEELFSATFSEEDARCIHSARKSTAMRPGEPCNLKSDGKDLMNIPVCHITSQS